MRLKIRSQFRRSLLVGALLFSLGSLLWLVVPTPNPQNQTDSSALIKDSQLPTPSGNPPSTQPPDKAQSSSTSSNGLAVIEMGQTGRKLILRPDRKFPYRIQEIVNGAKVEYAASHVLAVLEKRDISDQCLETSTYVGFCRRGHF
jgi:hypothetical protein